MTTIDLYKAGDRIQYVGVQGDHGDYDNYYTYGKIYTIIQVNDLRTERHNEGELFYVTMNDVGRKNSKYYYKFRRIDILPEELFTL